MKYRVQLLPMNLGVRDVEAEYFKVENGALYFRNPVRNDYPQCVHVFAPGSWLDVTNAPEHVVQNRDIPAPKRELDFHECPRLGECTSGMTECSCAAMGQ
jgi:hypothetical protein